MKNLAGVAECDTDIRRELARSYIDAVDIEKGNTEVPYSVIGKLGDMTLRRAWYYWVVECRVPLAIARALYADPVGKTDIRVAGHCGCPPPEEGAEWFASDGVQLLKRNEDCTPDLVEVLERNGYRLVDDPASEGEPFVTSYHIDSEVGLRVFADTVRRHNLAPMEYRELFGDEVPEHLRAPLGQNPLGRASA